MSLQSSVSSTRGTATKLRVLQAARDLLVDDGPRAFSLRAVAGRAGLSLSNLQFYYRDQATLLRSLLDDELQNGRRLVDAALTEKGSPSDAATGISRALGALLDQQRDVRTMKLYLSLWSFASSHAVVREALQEFYRSFVEQLVTYLREHEPHLSAAVARDRARAAIALLEGVSLFQSGLAGALAPRHIQLVKRALMDVVAPQKPNPRKPRRRS